MKFEPEEWDAAVVGWTFIGGVVGAFLLIRYVMPFVFSL
jgi:hypothetical protein